VELDDDFTSARIFVSVMAPEPRRTLALEALQRAAGAIRRMIAPELHIRRIPVLQFKLDDSVRRGLDTLAAIDQAMRELGEKPEWERADSDPAAGGHAGDDAAVARGERAEPRPGGEQEDA
jgi:hypothetical protein